MRRILAVFAAIAVLVGALVLAAVTGVVPGVPGLTGLAGLSGASTGCDLSKAGACLRILFIGNSYTYTNDLPGTFASMARAGGHQVEIASVTKGGVALADLLSMPETTAALKPGRWDYVVLQEQSSIPASATARVSVMFPAVRTLATRIEMNAGRPILFLTWGHRDGWPEEGISTYASMQARVTDSYRTIAREVQAPIAPAGEAWAAARSQLPQLSLWQDDGSHPTSAGTYLAAATFYATIYRSSPETVSFNGSLAPDDALAVRRIAATTVLADPARWFLP